MPIDFLAHLPADRRDTLRRKIAAEAREAARLYALPDRWLGEAILKAAGAIRAASPRYSTPSKLVCYNESLLWAVIPELARRLGCTPDANEENALRGRQIDGTQHDVLPSFNPAKFREYAAISIWNAQPSYMNEPHPGADLELLSFCFRVPANGSPLAIALDRVCPPNSQTDDPIAREIREISVRRGLPQQAAWSPAMQDYEQSRSNTLLA